MLHNRQFFDNYYTIRCFSLVLFVLMLANSCAKHEPISTLEVARRGLHSAAFSENGEFVSVGSIHHGGSLWRIASRERLFTWNHSDVEPSTIIAIEFSENGKLCVTATPQTLVVWLTSTGESARFWTAPDEILSLSLSSSGRYAALGLENHQAVIFDIERGGVKRRFHHLSRVMSVDYSRDGRRLLTGSEDQTAVLWDIQSGKKLRQLRHEDEVQLVRLSNDGTLALSVSQYDRATVWETKSGRAKGDIPLTTEKLKRGLTFTAAHFSEDNSQLLTGRPDQRVELWDLNRFARMAEWVVPKRSQWKPSGAAVIGVAFAETEGQFRVAASNGFIHTLQMPTDK